MSAVPSTPQPENLCRTKQQILAIDDLIGGWTIKADLRQTGMSVHFKFDKRVDIGTTARFLTLIENSPGMLVNALRLLLGEEQVIEETTS